MNVLDRVESLFYNDSNTIKFLENWPSYDSFKLLWVNKWKAMKTAL